MGPKPYLQDEWEIRLSGTSLQPTSTKITVIAYKNVQDWPGDLRVYNCALKLVFDKQTHTVQDRWLKLTKIPGQNLKQLRKINGQFVNTSRPQFAPDTMGEIKIFHFLKALN